MTRQSRSDANPEAAARPALRADKAIVFSLSIVALLAMTYLAWYQLAGGVWNWATEVWWRWAPALVPFCFLLVGPPLLIVGIVTIMKERPRTRRLFRLKATVLLTVASLALLIYWAFVNDEPDWSRGHWLTWSFAALALSITASGARLFIVVQPVEERYERHSYADEWRFNHGDTSTPPALGLAMSGGGIRSAAFNLGVLRALHEGGLLRSIDVMSAVSGGSYIMSWFLLQPFYAARSAAQHNRTFDIAGILEEMFDPEGRFQEYLHQKPEVIRLLDTSINAVVGATLMQPFRAFFSVGDDLDAFNGSGGIQRGYREGIQKLFHGHPDKDSPQKIENALPVSWRKNKAIDDFLTVAPVTYRELSRFLEDNGLPFFIFNGAVLVERSRRGMLWPAAFELTADELGSDVCGYRQWDDLAKHEAEVLREAQDFLEGQSKLYRALDAKREPELPGRWVHLVNLAPAISGAAIGLSRHDPARQPRAMKRATWMPFVGNIDLGYLFPRTVLNSETALYVSDGGHVENLGAYALIRRQCGTIIVVDAEHEKGRPYTFASYRKLQQQLEKEECLLFQVDAIDSYLANNAAGLPPAVTTGIVKPLDETDSDYRSTSVIYIKLVLDASHANALPSEVLSYADKNSSFPQDPTTNQTYTREQFTAYSKLGHYVGTAALAEVDASQFGDTC